MADTITKTDIKLAEDLAQYVNIIDVRLLETKTKYQWGQVSSNSMNIAYRSEFLKNEEKNTVDIRVYFLLKTDDENKESGKEPTVLIQVTYGLSYHIEELSHFSDDKIQAFGNVNAIYHAWPFLREYVYSTLSRMGLPPMTLPVFRIDEETAEPKPEDTEK